MRLLIKGLERFNTERLRSVFGERIAEITAEIIAQRRVAAEGAFAGNTWIMSRPSR
jgi:hypothetical protein